MEDEEIVTLFLLRDEKAIEKTQEKYGSRLRKLAYELTEDLSGAEECENDTYLQAWHSMPPNAPYGYLYPFLARIARHVALNFCRDRGRIKRKASIEALSEELQQSIPAKGDVEAAISAAALQELLHHFLSGLSPEKRKIFLRRYWYLDSIETIADGYGISQSKVKVTLYRCRKQLKRMLEGEGYKL